MSERPHASLDADADDSLVTRPHRSGSGHFVKVDSIVAAHRDLTEAARNFAMPAEPDEDPTPNDVIHHAGHVELPGPAHGEPAAVVTLAPADDPKTCCSHYPRSPIAAERAAIGNGHHPACHRYRRVVETPEPDPVSTMARKELAVRIRTWAHELIEHGQVLERLAAEMVRGVEPTELSEARRIAGYRGEWIADVGRELLGLAANDDWSR